MYDIRKSIVFNYEFDSVYSHIVFARSSSVHERTLYRKAFVLDDSSLRHLAAMVTSTYLLSIGVWVLPYNVAVTLRLIIIAK